MAEPKADWGRFVSVSPKTNYRLVYRSLGPDKTGKDHFGLTMPGPVAILSFDLGLEGVVEKFLRQGKEVRHIEYQFTKGDVSQEAAQVMCDQLEEDVAVAVRNARSIIIDTETEMWDLFRYAEHGLNAQGVATTKPKDYVKLNSRYRDLIQLAYDSGVNLQLIQKVKERWHLGANGSPCPSGIFEASGFKEAGYIVQATIRHSWTQGPGDETGFGVHIVNCRQNMGLAGENFYNTNFPEIATMIFGGDSDGMWD